MREAERQKEAEEALFFENSIIAYEPIWAIGTGEVPSLQQINETQKLGRKLINEKYGSLAANSVRIIYGGSLSQENSKNIFSTKYLNHFIEFNNI